MYQINLRRIRCLLIRESYSWDLGMFQDFCLSKCAKTSHASLTRALGPSESVFKCPDQTQIRGGDARKGRERQVAAIRVTRSATQKEATFFAVLNAHVAGYVARSEERRVGKECRSRCAT